MVVFAGIRLIAGVGKEHPVAFSPRFRERLKIAIDGKIADTVVRPGQEQMPVQLPAQPDQRSGWPRLDEAVGSIGKFKHSVTFAL